MSNYCHYLKYKYSCTFIFLGLIFSGVIILIGYLQKNNNYVTIIAYPIPIKTILYNITVTNECRAIQSKYLNYSRCNDILTTNDDKCSVNDKCDDVICDPCYYKCGLCRSADEIDMCKMFVMEDLTYTSCGYDDRSGPVRGCRMTMANRYDCIDTSKEPLIPTFNCPVYPIRAIASCSEGCSTKFHHYNMSCFPDDFNCNCNKCGMYSQKVCNLTRNYYYSIQTKYGYQVNDTIHFIDKYNINICAIGDNNCLGIYMNNTEKINVYYDIDHPNNILYETPENNNYCEPLIIIGIVSCCMLIMCAGYIYRKSNDYRDYLLEEQRNIIEKKDGVILELQLRPPDVGGIVYETSKQHFGTMYDSLENKRSIE